jgi:hypothetical protein
MRTSSENAKDIKHKDNLDSFVYKERIKEGHISKLNRTVDIPQFIQPGPTPMVMEEEDFIDRLNVGFQLVKKCDPALIVLELENPINNSSPSDTLNPMLIRRAISLCRSRYPILSNLAETDNYYKFVCILVFTLLDHGRHEPLLWLKEGTCNSNESEIKDWISGTSPKDLITNLQLVRGFEAAVVVDFASEKGCNSAISRCKVQYIGISLKDPTLLKEEAVNDQPMQVDNIKIEYDPDISYDVKGQLDLALDDNDNSLSESTKSKSPQDGK